MTSSRCGPWRHAWIELRLLAMTLWRFIGARFFSLSLLQIFLTAKTRSRTWTPVFFSSLSVETLLLYRKLLQPKSTLRCAGRTQESLLEAIEHSALPFQVLAEEMREAIWRRAKTGWKRRICVFVCLKLNLNFGSSLNKGFGLGFVYVVRIVWGSLGRFEGYWRTSFFC